MSLATIIVAEECDRGNITEEMFNEADLVIIVCEGWATVNKSTFKPELPTSLRANEVPYLIAELVKGIIS